MKTVEVLAFIDWNSQMYNAKVYAFKDPERRAEKTLKEVVRVIGLILTNIDSSLKFRVKLRLYHGWHQGITPTENRRALKKLENSPDFSLDKKHLNVICELPLGYGETLLNALPSRLGKSMQIHLPDTLRPVMHDKKYTTQERREKMVDSALVCDLLTHARTDASDWRLILAEDDDIIPALFVSEAWSKSKGGKTLLIRRRDSSKHLILDGLTKEYPNDF